MSAAAAPTREDDLLDGREGGRLALAFLVALGLHLGALALVTLWRSAEPRPPGEQQITIDLAPQIVEAPTVETVETSQPAGVPSEVASVQPPVESVTAESIPLETVPVETPVAERPLERSAVPPPVEVVSPPPEATALPEPPPPVAAAPPVDTTAVLPPDARPIESTAVEALPLPQAVVPLPGPEPVAAEPPPEAVTAQAPPIPKPRTTPRPVERRTIAKPEPARPPPARETLRRERPLPTPSAAQPGAAGQTQREAARGSASPSNTGGSRRGGRRSERHEPLDGADRGRPQGAAALPGFAAERGRRWLGDLALHAAPLRPRDIGRDRRQRRPSGARRGGAGDRRLLPTGRPRRGAAAAAHHLRAASLPGEVNGARMAPRV